MPPSPFPFHTLPRLRSADVAAANAAVAWLGAVSIDKEGGELEVLGLRGGGWRVVPVGKRSLDSSSAMVWIEREGLRALVALPGEVVRPLARRLLASPSDLSAPRPLTSAEQAVATMLVAAALAQLAPRLSAEPWQPVPELRAALAATEQRVASWPCVAVHGAIGGSERTLYIWVPPQLVHRRPARLGALPSWHGRLSVELPVVVAAAPMEPASLERLAVRDVIVVEAPPSGAELRVGRGAFGLRTVPGQAHAVIESGYLRRVPSDAPLDSAGALADDVTVELTVTLGTTTMSLRQLAELAAGQVISLGRPLHGPFELRAKGQLIGSGELVDIDGALGVRVASLLP